jgi:hypothetical protein
MTGVASTPPSGDANPGNLSISGQREASNGFRVNGSDVEEDVNMGSSIVPNLDSIDSFRVLTSNFDAEYGNSSGGQVLVTTKAGTASRALSAFDLCHNLVTSFHYQLPSPEHWGLLHAMASDWSVAGIARFTSGLPVTLLNNNDTSLLGSISNGINNNGVDTPAFTSASLSLNRNPRGGAPVFDASQFSLSTLGTQGNARRRPGQSLQFELWPSHQRHAAPPRPTRPPLPLLKPTKGSVFLTLSLQ